MLSAKARLLTRSKWMLPTLVLLGLVLGTCAPSTPFDPIALRQVSPDTIELLYTPCASKTIQSVEVLVPSGQVFNDTDERRWKVVFDPPTSQQEFLLGETPPSSSVVIPWQGLPSEETLVVLIVTASGEKDYQDFKLSDFKDQRVRFHAKNMTPEDYEKERACK